MSRQSLLNRYVFYAFWPRSVPCCRSTNDVFTVWLTANAPRGGFQTPFGPQDQPALDPAHAVVLPLFVDRGVGQSLWQPASGQESAAAPVRSWVP